MARPRLEHRTNRKRPITVSVSDRDRATIEARAKASGLPLSAYMRQAGLGIRTRSVLDHEAVLQLAAMENVVRGLRDDLASALDGTAPASEAALLRRLMGRIARLVDDLATAAGRV